MEKALKSITVNKEMILCELRKQILTHRSVAAWIFKEYVEDFEDYTIKELEDLLKEKLHIPSSWEEMNKTFGAMPEYLEMSFVEGEKEKIFFYLVNVFEDMRFRNEQYSLQMYAHQQDEKKSKILRGLVVNVNKEQKCHSIRMSLALGGPQEELGLSVNIMQVTEVFFWDDLPSKEERFGSPIAILLDKNMGAARKKKEIKKHFGLEIPSDLYQLIETYSEADLFLGDETFTISLKKIIEADPSENLN